MKLFSFGDFGDDVPNRFYCRADVHRDPTQGAYMVGFSWARWHDRLDIWLNPLPFVSGYVIVSKLPRIEEPRRSRRWGWWWEKRLPDRRLSASVSLRISSMNVGWTWYRDDICTQLHLHPLPFITLAFEQVKREATR